VKGHRPQFFSDVRFDLFVESNIARTREMDIKPFMACQITILYDEPQFQAQTGLSSSDVLFSWCFNLECVITQLLEERITFSNHLRFY